jgi:hypothetical protein
MRSRLKAAKLKQEVVLMNLEQVSFSLAVIAGSTNYVVIII